MTLHKSNSVADAIRYQLQALVDVNGLRGTARSLGIPLSQVRGIIDGRDISLGNATNLASALGFQLTVTPMDASRGRFADASTGSTWIDTSQSFLCLVRAYCNHTGLSHSYVSQLAGGYSMLLRRTEAGHTMTLKTYARAMTWFSKHWPEDLAWPSDIPRPQVKSMPKSKPDFAGSRSYVPVTRKQPRPSLLRRLLPLLSPEKRIALGTIWMLIKALFSQRHAEQIAARAKGMEWAEQYQQHLASQESDQPTKH